MNRRGRYPRMKLPVCPKCGLDSGQRKILNDSAMERYVVVCESCGAMTLPCRSQTMATRNWCGGNVK